MVMEMYACDNCHFLKKGGSLAKNPNFTHHRINKALSAC